MRKKLSEKICIIILVLLIVVMPMLPFNVTVADSTTEKSAQSNDTSDDEKTASSEPEFTSFEDLNGKTVSMLTGAPFEELISSKVKNVKEFTYYTSMADMILGLKSGKTDAGLMNNAVGQLAVNRDPEIAFLPENLQDSTFGIAFEKGDDRVNEWRAAYERIPEDKINELWEKWTGSDESKKIMITQDWPGNAGTYEVAACDTLEPMSYAGEGGQLYGFDVEVILYMARELDVHVNFTGMDFAAALAAVESGKADMACGSIIVTAERKEKMDFIEYYPAAFVLLVRTVQTAEANETFLEKIKSSFYKTFIKEDRYLLFLSGIATTVMITFFSIIFGTILGFVIYLLCRNGNPAVNKLAGVFVWLVQGLPAVVLLMVLYYIIFGHSDISGVIVYVIAFTLVFGAGTFGMLKTGVNAVDKGQAEAAYSLGYSDMKCFFRIILPQAIPHFLPIFKGAVVSLLKATAIVGYIAVQDLTKMGDIIRGRTYEAFFPLIAVAIIYVIFGSILRLIIGKTELSANPKKRKKDNILKGIKLDNRD